jgi:hypothetical protein
VFVECKDYLGQSIMHLAVLPARVVYLIREGSADGLRQAVHAASSRWGGAAEPIIPAAIDGSIRPLYKQVVGLAGVEEAVNVDLPEAVAASAAAQLGLGVMPLSWMGHGGESAFTSLPSAVAAAGTPDGDLAPVMAAESCSLWEAVAAGCQSPDALEASRLFGFTPRPAATGSDIAVAQIQERTLLDATVRQFSEHHATNIPGAHSTVIWVADPDDVEDCVVFWNLRAMRSFRFEPCPVLLLPSTGLDVWKDIAQALRTGPLVRPAEFAPDVLLASLHVDDDRLHHIATALGFELSGEEARSGHSWPVELRTEPFTYLTDVDPWRWFVFGRRYGLDHRFEMQLFAEPTDVRVPSPVTFRHIGRTLLRLSGPPFDGLPRRPSIASRIVRNAEWRGDALQLRTLGLNEYQLSLAIPSLADATMQVLGDSTLSHHPSEKGRLAAAFESKAPLSLLLQPYVRDVLTALATPRAAELTRQLEQARSDGVDQHALLEIAATWGGRSERRYRRAIELERVPNAEAIMITERLCALGLAERGLETRCERCGMNSFVPLSAGIGQPECPACGGGTQYTVNKKELNIYYRLNAFVDRIVDQGVLPHLHVLAELYRRAPLSYLLTAEKVRLADTVGDAPEVDIVGLFDGRVLAGEVKTFATQFTDRQVERDVMLSARLGADIHLLAALDTVPDEVRERAELRCENAGLDLLIIDSASLTQDH